MERKVGFACELSWERLICGDLCWAAERPGRAPRNRLGKTKVVVAQQIAMAMAQRGEARHTLVLDRGTVALPLRQRAVQVARVPERDDIDEQPERPELILHDNETSVWLLRLLL